MGFWSNPWVITIVGGLVVALVAPRLISRGRKGGGKSIERPPHGAVVSGPERDLAQQQAAAEKKRVAEVLLHNATKLRAEMLELAKHLGESGSDGDENRHERLNRLVEEFDKEIKPTLGKMRDMAGEQLTRDAYRDLAIELPQALRPPAWVFADDNTTEDWIKLYRPMKQNLERLAGKLEPVIRWARESGDLTLAKE
jgi:hypothetical protein